MTGVRDAAPSVPRCGDIAGTWTRFAGMSTNWSPPGESFSHGCIEVHIKPGSAQVLLDVVPRFAEIDSRPWNKLRRSFASKAWRAAT